MHRATLLLTSGQEEANLYSLGLADADADVLVNALTRTAASVVDLADNQLGDRFGVTLGTALKTSQLAVEALGIGGNAITDRGGVKIAEGLAFNTKIKELNLSGNEELGVPTGAALHHVLQTNRTLEFVYLDSTRVPFAMRERINALCESNVAASGSVARNFQQRIEMLQRVVQSPARAHAGLVALVMLVIWYSFRMFSLAASYLVFM